MAINPPLNSIVTGKYTIGKEYLLLDTHKEYQGYYYELGDKTFAGKKFDSNAPELIKIASNKVNSLLANSITSAYAKVSNFILNNINIPSIPFAPTSKDFANGYVVRYFIKKINSNPIIIKEVNKETFDNTKSDSLYQTLEVNYNFNISETELDNLDKKMPGLKAYLSTDTLPTSGDENNPYIR